MTKRKPRVTAHRNQHNADNVYSQWTAIPPPPEALDEEGACVGKPQEWFFKDDPSPKGDVDAKACCAVCPVRKPCLAYALSLSQGIDYGIWGGLNRNERMTLRKTRGSGFRRTP